MITYKVVINTKWSGKEVELYSGQSKENARDAMIAACRVLRYCVGEVTPTDAAVTLMQSVQEYAQKDIYTTYYACP